MVKALSRGSAQKQDFDASAATGGTQAPCTSKSFPQRVAHTGRPEVKGTNSPSGAAWEYTTGSKMLASTTRIDDLMSMQLCYSSVGGFHFCSCSGFQLCGMFKGLVSRVASTRVVVRVEVTKIHWAVVIDRTQDFQAQLLHSSINECFFHQIPSLSLFLHASRVVGVSGSVVFVGVSLPLRNT